ncbi:acetyltransferase (GNAT) family protein [Hoeflea sp. IMCC20628]|uniref:GNAT family N-acetyltransferase n=1 Tax=Hoeflea sp. IMCC20628 TaxID=1620421 RepID=UPI00063AAA9A|nr:GNAT family N-acetyltransferase [Hoeflea sp. IMCC20628]AKH99510.1 acetyltransferase (GNAT) family protein [Hoeflea sp. IMCC20628]
MTRKHAGLSFAVLSADEIPAALTDLARLRITVFAAWPYLYDGDAAYEAGYLARFAASPGAVVIAAHDPDGRMVGAATAAPLIDHADEFAAPFADAGLDPADYFYLAESVLLPEFRGQGAGRHFFEMREAAGRAQGFSRAVFASVQRPAAHPARPEDYLPLDAFWRRLGYQLLAGLQAEFSWRDIGDSAESLKTLQVWGRDL